MFDTSKGKIKLNSSAHYYYYNIFLGFFFYFKRGYFLCHRHHYSVYNIYFDEIATGVWYFLNFILFLIREKDLKIKLRKLYLLTYFKLFMVNVMDVVYFSSLFSLFLFISLFYFIFFFFYTFLLIIINC